jgi:hypothetical protein
MTMNVNFEEITETVQERLSESFASKAKVSLVKGKTGIRYAVALMDVTKGDTEEFWFNLDPLDSDAYIPRLRFAVRILDTGRFYRYKDEKFGATERPRIKAEEWWRRMASKDVEWMNKQFRDWLASSAGGAFIERHKLEGCLCIKNWLETKR